MAGTILTNIGLSKLATATPQNQLNITHIAVGDGNGGFPTLSPSMTALTNEVWRGDSSNPVKDSTGTNYVYFETNIPPEVGPFDVREIACFDSDGDMIAIGHTSLIAKPDPADDANFTVATKIFIALENTSDFDLIYQNTEVTSHNTLIDRNAIGAHDEIYARSVDCIKDLENYTVGLVEGQKFNVTGFYDGATLGGGEFVYQPSKPREDHNGATVISPAAIAAWDGTREGLSSLLNWSGTGSGCFVLKYDSVTFDDFGAKGDGVTDDTVALTAGILSAKKTGFSIYLPAEKKYITSSPLPLVDGLTLIGDFSSERNDTQRSVIQNKVTTMWTYDGSNKYDIRFIGVRFEGGESNQLFEDTSNTSYSLWYSEIRFCGMQGFSSHFRGVMTACHICNNWMTSYGQTIFAKGADSQIKDNIINTENESVLTDSDFVVETQALGKTDISGNFITGRPAMPLKLGFNTRGCTITKNRLDAPNTSVISGAGIYVQNAIACVITENYFYRVLGNPFSIFTAAIVIADSDSIYVNANMVDSPVTNTSGMQLVRVIDSSDGVKDIYIGKFLRRNAENLTKLLSSGNVIFAEEDFYGKVTVNGELEINGTLDLNGAVQTFLNSETSPVMQSGVSSDGELRFTMRADGLMLWGDGTSPLDASLYRDVTGVLRSSKGFIPGVYNNTSRPDPSSVGVGTTIYNTTTLLNNTSDGTNWRDASGNIV